MGEGGHQEGPRVEGVDPEEDFPLEEEAEEHQEVVGHHEVEEGVVVEVEWVEERRWWWSHTGTQVFSSQGERRTPW